jgi:hypothetical protein
VDLCVPNYLHRPMTEAAAAVRKHVICSKPMTAFDGTSLAPGSEPSSVSRAEMLQTATHSTAAMVEATRAAGVLLMYAENWVYAPSIAKANRLATASGGAILGDARRRMPQRIALAVLEAVAKHGRRRAVAAGRTSDRSNAVPQAPGRCERLLRASHFHDCAVLRVLSRAKASHPFSIAVRSRRTGTERLVTIPSPGNHTDRERHSPTRVVEPGRPSRKPLGYHSRGSASGRCRRGRRGVTT